MSVGSFIGVFELIFLVMMQRDDGLHTRGLPKFGKHRSTAQTSLSCWLYSYQQDSYPRGKRSFVPKFDGPRNTWPTIGFLCFLLHWLYRQKILNSEMKDLH